MLADGGMVAWSQSFFRGVPQNASRERYRCDTQCSIVLYERTREQYICAMKIKMNVQLIIAVVLSLSGVALVFMAFWVEPTGQIDSSVLIAFGETSTFAGGLFGIDYNYKYKLKEKVKSLQENKDNDN